MNQFNQRRHGACVVIVLAMFAAAVLFAFFAINIANMQRNHTSGQIAVDLVSRWGADLLARDVSHSGVRKRVAELVARNWTVNNKLDPGWLCRNRKNIGIEIESGSVSPARNGEILARRMLVNAIRVNVCLTSINRRLEEMSSACSQGRGIVSNEKVECDQVSTSGFHAALGHYLIQVPHSMEGYEQVPGSRPVAVFAQVEPLPGP